MKFLLLFHDFLGLGEFATDRCERVDVGSVAGGDDGQCQPDPAQHALPVSAVRLPNLEQQRVPCQDR